MSDKLIEKLIDGLAQISHEVLVHVRPSKVSDRFIEKHSRHHRLHPRTVVERFVRPAINGSATTKKNIKRLGTAARRSILSPLR